MKPKKYTVVRRFKDGGTHTQQTDVKFEVGFTPSKPLLGPWYEIISVIENY